MTVYHIENVLCVPHRHVKNVCVLPSVYDDASSHRDYRSWHSHDAYILLYNRCLIIDVELL